MKNNNKKMGKIIKSIATVLIFLVLILSIVNLAHQRISGDDTPTLFGFGAANILTGSMEPTIPINSLIIIQEKDNYEINDIVTFEDVKNPVTHRIVEINGDEIVTKGDANNTEDDPISKDKIIGKVVLSVPVIGGILTSLSVPQIIILILVVSLIIYFISSIFKRKGEKDNDE